MIFAYLVCLINLSLQEQLSRAQAEKRSLQEALEQTKAQIAGNNAGIVTAATEVGVHALAVCVVAICLCFFMRRQCEMPVH